MTVTQKFKKQLAAHDPGGACVVAVEHEGVKLRCELARLGTLACEMNLLAVTSDKLAGATMDQLQAISSQLAEQLTYLLEPIGPIENDAEHFVVQMRSIPPQKNEDGRSYYELQVSRQGVSLCRYTKTNGTRRQTIPAALTVEVLLRLVGDCAEAARL